MQPSSRINQSLTVTFGQPQPQSEKQEGSESSASARTSKAGSPIFGHEKPTTETHAAKGRPPPPSEGLKAQYGKSTGFLGQVLAKLTNKNQNPATAGSEGPNLPQKAQRKLNDAFGALINKGLFMSWAVSKEHALSEAVVQRTEESLQKTLEENCLQARKDCQGKTGPELQAAMEKLKNAKAALSEKSEVKLETD